MAPSRRDITLMLRAWGDGDQEALHKLTPLVYQELRRVAHGYMVHERRGHTLQTTALVHEAFVRLVNVREIGWQSRAHFYAICARTMRRILIDFARSRQYQKRGGEAVHVSLDNALGIVPQPAVDLVKLNDALDALSQLDPRKSQVVELRFFGGLTVEETAEVLKISPETVMRDWKMAKAWLAREPSGDAGHEV